MTVAALIALGLVAAGCGSGSKSSSSGSTASSRSSTTTSTTSPSNARPDSAIWPFAGGSAPSTDPVAVVKTFAVAYLGFVDPVAGAFQPGDAGSGQVSVQPKTTGAVTTVSVRRVTADGSWWVVAASTSNLQLQSPAASTSVTSPVTLSGRSTAFEGTVNVEIRQDGSTAPLATGFVNGGANGTMGPFSKPFTFTAPTAKRGAIVLRTRSAETGNTAEASVIRVQFP